LLIAIASAFVTSEVAWWWSIDQPTTRREWASKTTQQYPLPSRVGCSVMSVSHSWFGALRLKSRQTRSSEVATLASDRRSFRAGRPYKLRFGHQLVHQLPRDRDPATKPQLSTHPPVAVHAA
jgi:hypothetical protein